MDKNVTVVSIANVLSDPTHRLDALYWREFAVDLNSESQFKSKPLGQIAELREDWLKLEPIPKLTYPSFHVSYAGKVMLGPPIETAKTSKRLKLARTGDLVLSRINCCRGSIAVVESWQDRCVCTSETHVLKVTDADVQPDYLQIILRHPYYQDQIFSRCTGDSLERKRFPEQELLSFQVPIPPLKMQRDLAELVTNLIESIGDASAEIERLRGERNQFVLGELGIDLFFEEGGESEYPLRVSDLDSASGFRLDFEHNKPSFAGIGKLEDGKYPLVRIASQDPQDRILIRKITSGSTPPGGIYSATGVPLLHAGNVRENALDITVLHFVPPGFHKSLARSRLAGGEVLVTIAGTIGRAGVNTVFVNANVNQAIAVLRVNDSMHPLFLSAYLNSDAGRIQFAKHRHDFGTPNINQTELGNLLVPKPPVTAQEAISKEVRKLEDRLASLQTQRAAQLKEISKTVTGFLLGKETYESSVVRLK